jgi:phosphoribosylanthranilate isomerase
MSHRTRVKICGITNPRDAAAAAACGADAIGMVFYAPAPRSISIEKAQAILEILPPFVTPVGLFVDASTSDILKIVEPLRLRHVQLHGQETPQQIAELRGLSVIKAVRVTPRFSDELRKWSEAVQRLSLRHLRGFLTETPGTEQAGGTGVPNDFSAVHAAQLDGAFEGLGALIAAGGLMPDSVGRIVSLLRPWAVDVSSGVEISRGIKSTEMMQAFIDAVRHADAP